MQQETKRLHELAKSHFFKYWNIKYKEIYFFCIPIAIAYLYLRVASTPAPIPGLSWGLPTYSQS